MPLPLVTNPADVAAVDPATIRLVDLRSREAWAEGHPPGAVHLEAKLLNRSDPPAGGLLPDARTMAELLASLALDDGAGGTRHVVALDAGGATEAARLVWVLHAYGLTSCSWLNGGMRAWVAADGKLERGETSTSSGGAASSSPGNPDDAPSDTPAGDSGSEAAADGSSTAGAPELGAGTREIVSADALLGELDDPDLAILDVRGAAEYAGTDVRSAMGGHVPGARHLEWTRLLDAEGRLLDDDTLRARFEEAGLDPGGRAVVYCQTHQRSAVTWLALRHLGHEDVRALDGAWSVWGNRPDLPKERDGA